MVTYRATDLDGLTAEAFVSVPPVRDRAPFLTSTEPLQVRSGIAQEIPLRDYVTVSTTNAPRITTGEKVTAVNDDGSGLIVGNDVLRFQSPAGYTGPASITFEVTDGTGPDNGNVATLTIPIDVLPSSVIAPTFAGAVVRAEAGEGETSFDLRDATVDPDPGDMDAMRFDDRGGSMAGVQTRIADGVFIATAAATVAPGTSGAFQIAVIDPYGNETPGTVIVEVVASNRPLAQARPNTGEATASVATTVDVVSDDFNPFQDDGVPLRMVSAEVVGGVGDVSNTDREVTVTPGTDFSGVLTVRYTVQDATERIERQVSGTLTLNVKARPEAPPRPNVDAVGDSQVTLTWAPPSANGAPITGYIVQSIDGAISFPCASTTCTVTGLVNNTTYLFQVIAQNVVGDSDPSAASNEARPDVRPEQPAPPAVTRGDTQVMLSWQPPANRGSPIQGYVVEISPPAPGGVVQQQAAGTSHTWTGLLNGTAYTFRIQAVNLADEPSDFSAYSRSVTPAGPPAQVQGVSATPNRDIPGEVQMRVTWTAPDANGAPITRYTVTPSNGAAPAAATGTSASFTFAATGEDVAFTVTATNDAGTGQPSAASAPVRAFTAPSAPSGVTTVDGDGRVQVSWEPGSRNGLRAEEVSFEIRGGGAGTQSFGPGNWYTGMSNVNGPYTMEVRAVAVADGQTYASEWVRQAGQARPFGPPPRPNGRVEGQVNQVTFHYSPNGTNGRPLDRLEYVLDDGRTGWTTVRPAGSGQFSIPREPDDEACIRVRVFDTEGTESEHVVGCGFAQAPPDPQLTLSGGGLVGVPGQPGVRARNFVLDYRDLPPASYRYTCHDPGGQFREGSWSNSSPNGQTPRDSYTFCANSEGGPYTLVLYRSGAEVGRASANWTPTP